MAVLIPPVGQKIATRLEQRFLGVYRPLSAPSKKCFDGTSDDIVECRSKNILLNQQGIRPGDGVGREPHFLHKPLGIQSWITTSVGVTAQQRRAVVRILHRGAEHERQAYRGADVLFHSGDANGYWCPPILVSLRLRAVAGQNLVRVIEAVECREWGVAFGDADPGCRLRCRDRDRRNPLSAPGIREVMRSMMTSAPMINGTSCKSPG
jgi:hypothetical protein